MKISQIHGGGNAKNAKNRPAFRTLIALAVVAATLSACSTSGDISKEDYDRFQKRIEKEAGQRRIDKMMRISTHQEIIDAMKRRKTLPRP